MAKKKRGASVALKEPGNAIGMLVSLVAWVTGLLVALAVGFGMVDGTLTIPGIHSVITEVAGWIVVVLALLGALLALINKGKR